MVFNPDNAPQNRQDFMQWYRNQTQWKETHGYNNPEITTQKLRNWFLNMLDVFPALNGPYAQPNSGDELADYNIGYDIIYVTFGWPYAEKAYNAVRALAEKNKVGFFDVSADDGDIIIPGISPF